jgi:hypothetical protein
LCLKHGEKHRDVMYQKREYKFMAKELWALPSSDTFTLETELGWYSVIQWELFKNCKIWLRVAVPPARTGFFLRMWCGGGSNPAKCGSEDRTVRSGWSALRTSYCYSSIRLFSLTTGFTILCYLYYRQKSYLNYLTNG